MARLDADGSVVGLIRDGAWDTGQVTLDRGDLFVHSRDGISEAMNDADDEWGEERLIEAAQAMRGTSAKSMLDHIMQSADGFVAGAPQYDDMTLIVARVG